MNFNCRLCVLVSTLFLLMAASESSAKITATVNDRVAGIYGGESAAQTVAAPDKVEAILLRPLPTEKQGRPTPLDEFEARSEPVKVDEATAKQLGKALTSSKSFDPPGLAVACIPIYGVQLVFQKGEDRVDVLICFECGTILTFHNKKKVKGALFERTPASLIAAMKKTFPEDKAMQSLKD